MVDPPHGRVHWGHWSIYECKRRCLGIRQISEKSEINIVEIVNQFDFEMRALLWLQCLDHRLVHIFLCYVSNIQLNGYTAIHQCGCVYKLIAVDRCHHQRSATVYRLGCAQIASMRPE